MYLISCSQTKKKKKSKKDGYKSLFLLVSDPNSKELAIKRKKKKIRKEKETCNH